VTAPETSNPNLEPLAEPVEDAPRSQPVRPSLRAVGAWLLVIGVAVALDGLVGGLAVVFVAAVLLAGLPTRLIGGVGVVLLALAPVAFLLEGVPTASDVSPALVIRSLLPHHLTFAGLVLCSAFALIDLAPHLQAWAAADRPDQDDGPPLGVALGAMVVCVVAIGALLTCRAVLVA
jgi:hypothetical protein